MTFKLKIIHFFDGFVQILTVVGGDALSCQIILFNLEETAVYNDNDMKIDVSMGCVKIVFLNWFLTSVLVSLFD